MAKKIPAFQFYPGDWLKDPALRRCSPAARGIWVDMLCLMFEAEQRGVLRSNSRAFSIQNLTKTISDCKPKHVQELINNGVVRVARKDGALYSNRLIREELHRRHLSKRGRKPWLLSEMSGEINRNKSQIKTGSSSSSSSSYIKKPPISPLKGDSINDLPEIADIELPKRTKYKDNIVKPEIPFDELHRLTMMHAEVEGTGAAFKSTSLSQGWIDYYASIYRIHGADGLADIAVDRLRAAREWAKKQKIKGRPMVWAPGTYKLWISNEYEGWFKQQEAAKKTAEQRQKLEQQAKSKETDQKKLKAENEQKRAWFRKLPPDEQQKWKDKIQSRGISIRTPELLEIMAATEAMKGKDE